MIFFQHILIEISREILDIYDLNTHACIIPSGKQIQHNLHYYIDEI